MSPFGAVPKFALSISSMYVCAALSATAALGSEHERGRETDHEQQ
jgi:hypothetical protein